MIYSSPQQILINLLLITNYYALYMELGTLYLTQLHLDPKHVLPLPPFLVNGSTTLESPQTSSPSLTLHIQLMPRFCGLRFVPLPSHFSSFTTDSHSSPAASTMATLLPISPSRAPTCRTKSFET